LCGEPETTFRSTVSLSPTASHAYWLSSRILGEKLVCAAWRMKLDRTSAGFGDDVRARARQRPLDTDGSWKGEGADGEVGVFN
jgi:hypothetical protein